MTDRSPAPQAPELVPSHDADSGTTDDGGENAWVRPPGRSAGTGPSPPLWEMSSASENLH